MSRLLLFYVLGLIVCGASSCKKSKLEKKQPDNLLHTYVSKMGGARIWAGTGANGFPAPGFDVFFSFQKTVLNDSAVIGPGNTLKYKSIDTAAKTITFFVELSGTLSGMSVVTETLVYNYAENSMHDSYSYGCDYCYGFLDVSTLVYPVNTSLKSAVSKMDGVISVSGICYDTISSPANRDSMYTINTNIQLTIVNDSTITCDKDFIGIGHDTLHYRSSNTNTIIFQTFHVPDDLGSFTSLTYNYGSNTYKFEQNKWNIDRHTYLSLQ